ncbi:MAG: phosphoenolpyruvate carboxylase [Flavobacteriales bacterium TMED96]|nr:MAG: phosphoenolpyruvate carboxylase [Flavobacteriales bacterium TMED96]|tara:strand:- start:7386 stop:9956 length:2571 start_codon:yes stop_codon:yes gene_type:complete
MARKTKLERFNEHVLSKFEIYNSLFLTLPFKSILKTSLLLPLFSDHCKSYYNKKKSPLFIVESFFNKYCNELNYKERINLMFSFIQFIERQIVLFDAIEDSAFSIVNNMHGRGTLRYIKEETVGRGKLKNLISYLESFKINLVLTAHPTQFYPGSVLGIINDLSFYISEGNIDEIKKLLLQLGRTRFFKKKKPTPLDEAMSLIWYLENIFYTSSSRIYNYIEQNILDGKKLKNELFSFGFWPCGDRDGNPYVTPEISIKTAKKLKYSIQRNYYRDLRKLRRKLTFDEVEEIIDETESRMYNSLLNKSKQISLNDFKHSLSEVVSILSKKHNGIYVEEVLDLYNKVKIFGYHFASLDIRQDSRVLKKVFVDIVESRESSKFLNIHLNEEYNSLDFEKKIDYLSKVSGNISSSIFKDPIIVDTLGSIEAMKIIQKLNGEKGSNRYIISNCSSLEDILILFALIRMTGWIKPSVDIIPLFETINDLEKSTQVLKNLYETKLYQNHLRKRNNMQIIMLGFSDGTKDGGYIMANWSIYKAKESLSQLSEKFKFQISFFDGRGGPPARGGGNTHQFYSSLGEEIASNDIQLTVQGQTISSNFGTLDSSQFNLEQLLSSGFQNNVIESNKTKFSSKDRKTFEKIANISYNKYLELKEHPNFLGYLENMTTLRYYSQTNIGSRPSSRSKSKDLNFEDLRAIPFVGSWSQTKQNIPGFYGVGTALNYFKKNGNFQLVKSLYDNSLFFKTLIANSMMSLSKSFFGLTKHISKDKEYGEFWNMLHTEFLLTKKMLLDLSGQNELMEDQPAGKKSIDIREEIVLPLLTIQQFALMKIRSNQSTTEQKVYEKLILRSLFGNINASRNSA